MALIEKNSLAGRGRPRGLSSREAETRRMKCYHLFLQGFSEAQIAGSLGFSQSSVSKYLASVHRRNSQWFESSKDPHNRYRGMFKLSIDRITQVIQEQWMLFHRTPQEKTETRSGILARILDGVELQSKLLGLTAAEIMDTLYFTEKFEQFDKQLEAGKRKLQDMIAERNLAERMLPPPVRHLPPPQT